MTMNELVSEVLSMLFECFRQAELACHPSREGLTQCFEQILVTGSSANTARVANT